MIFLVDKHCNINLVQWQSKRIKQVVHNSLAAETLPVSDGANSTVYISVLLSELYPELNSFEIPIDIYTVNKSLHDAIHSEKYVSEKRLCIDTGALRELIVQHKSTRILWTKSKNQLTGCLMKCTADNSRFIETMNIGNFKNISD